MCAVYVGGCVSVCCLCGWMCECVLFMGVDV